MAYECDEMLRDEVAAHAATRARLASAEENARDIGKLLDNERERAAQAERESREAVGHLGRLMLDLAASQASERELREALEGCRVWMIDSAGRDEALPGMAHPKRIANRAKDIRAMNAALSRAPGSTEALRAVLVDVALDAWINGAVNYRSEGSGVEVTAPSREYIEREFVARVLDRSDTTEGGRG